MQSSAILRKCCGLAFLSFSIVLRKCCGFRQPAFRPSGPLGRPRRGIFPLGPMRVSSSSSSRTLGLKAQPLGLQALMGFGSFAWLAWDLSFGTAVGMAPAVFRRQTALGSFLWYRCGKNVHPRAQLIGDLIDETKISKFNLC